MQTESPTPQPDIDANEARKRLGVINIARRLHLCLCRKDIAAKRSKIMGDVEFLRRSLESWKDKKGHFGRAVKMMVEAALAEAATDGRLTEAPA